MLICGNVQENVRKCESTSWRFASIGAVSVEVVTLGSVNETHKQRLSLSENCSLLIPQVRAKDAGVYYCQQSSSGDKQLPDATVDLSVVTCEYTDGFKRRLRCCNGVCLTAVSCNET